MRKRTATRLLGITLSAAMLAASLAGCGDSAQTQSAAVSDSTSAGSTSTDSASTDSASADSEADPALDTSKEVTLRMFAIADAPLNQSKADEYWPVLNAAVKDAVNATIDYTYASGNDYANNYQLALASGEKYDMIHSASWLNYTDHATKGAFLALDDLLPVYAPHIWEEFSDLWDSVRVNGKIYGIPTTGGDRSETAFFYREDLRIKYDCPEIKSIEDIATYLQAIKDNETDLLPSDDSQAMVYGNSFIPLMTGYQIVDTMGGKNSNFVIDPANPRKVLCTIEVPEYKEYMYIMKDFSDRGFWPKDVLSKNDWGVYSVINGKAAASFVGQFWNYSYLIPQTEAEHPDWELNFVPYCTINPDTVLTVADPTGGMISVGRNAENAARALMLIDYVHTHEDIWRLMNWGIEGVHYQITDGCYDESILEDPSVDKFNYFIGSLFNDEAFQIPDIGEWDGTAALQEQMKAIEQPNLLSGFVFDQTPISAEYTAVNQIRMEYGYPLNVGIVDDVDAAYEDFVKRSKDAGLEKCREEVERQINEFFDSNGRA